MTVALGTITRSASGPPPATYQDEHAAAEKWRAARDNRWKLRDAAAEILGRESRVATCGTVPLPGKVVTIRRKDGGRCYYSGAGACGSVWTCPVCAAKIAKRRALELRDAIDRHKQVGGVVTMITLTVRHGRADTLAELLERMKGATSRMWGGGWWQRRRASLGIVGSVRSLEVTWGHDTGWHPHAHVLIFSREPIDSMDFYQRWAVCAGHEGLETSWAAWEGGCVGSHEATGRYVAKMLDTENGWSAAEELTMWHYKTSGARFTPLDLVRGVLATGEAELADRWREYAAAYKGKRQLYWSPGLRAALGMGAETSDEDEANAEDEGGEIVCDIDAKIWRWVCGLGLRLELLHAVEQYGAEVLTEFFEYVYRLRREYEQRYN